MLDYARLKEFQTNNTDSHRCCRQIDRGDLIIRCQSCCNVPNFVQCVECGAAGDHANHNYSIQKEFFGQCGCGNSLMYTATSCCQNHQGQPKPLLQDLDLESFTFLLQQMGLALKKILKNDSRAVSVIGSSQVLTRIAAIAGLCSNENTAVSTIFKNRDNTNALRPRLADGCLVSDLAQLALNYGRASAQKMLVEVLPADSFYVEYSLLGLRSMIPIFVQKHNLRLALLQPMASPRAVLAAGGKFLDCFSNTVLDTFMKAEFSFENFQERFAGVMGHQVLRTASALRTILFDTKDFLPNLVKIQRALEHFVIDPNEHFENSSEIRKPLAMHGRFHESIYRDANFFTAIGISKDADITEMEQFQIKRKYLGKKQTDYQHLVEQMVRMVDAFHSDNPSALEGGFALHSPSFLQQFICDVSQQFQVNLATLIYEVSDKCDKKVEDLVSELIRPLILQNMWYLFVENGLEYKQNFDDFSGMLGQVDKLLSQKMDQLRCYDVVAQFFTAYPKQVAEVLIDVYWSTFGEYPIVFVDYINILNFMPRPQYTKDFLRHMTIAMDPLTYDFNESLDYKSFFDQDDIVAALKECYRIIPNSDSFKSSQIEFVGQEYFEPCIYLGLLENHIQRLSQFQSFIPALIQNPLIERGLLQFFEQDFLKEISNQIIQQFEDNTIGLGQAMLAARITRTAGIQLEATGYKSEQLNKLLIKQIDQFQPVSAKVNIKNRMAKLKAEQKQTETQLMTLAPATEKEKNQEKNNQEDDICQLCHEPIGVPFFVPAYVTICAFQNMEIPYFCYHKYHDACSRQLHECAVCGFSFERRYSLGHESGQSDWINEQARMIIYILELIEMNQSTKNRVIKELTKIKFMIRNTGNTKQFESKNNDVGILKSIIFNNLEMSSEALFESISSQLQIQKKQSIIKSDIFFKNSIQLAQQFRSVQCRKCQKDCGLEQDNPFICISCGSIYHLACANDDDEFSCPKCKFRFAFCPKVMMIVRHRGHLIYAPYKTIFGLFKQSLIGDRQDLQKHMINELELSLLCGDRQSVTRVTIKQIGFKLPPSNEAKQLVEIIQRMQRDGIGSELTNSLLEVASADVREEVQQLIQEHNREVDERKNAEKRRQRLQEYDIPSPLAQKVLRKLKSQLNNDEKIDQQVLTEMLSGYEPTLRREVAALVDRIHEFEEVEGMFCVKKLPEALRSPVLSNMYQSGGQKEYKEDSFM